MAPAKVAKGGKPNDLRMFFGPGGSQPKHVPAVQVSEARFSFVLQVNPSLNHRRRACSLKMKRGMLNHSPPDPSKARDCRVPTNTATMSVN